MRNPYSNMSNNSVGHLQRVFSMLTEHITSDYPNKDSNSLALINSELLLLNNQLAKLKKEEELLYEPDFNKTNRKSTNSFSI